MSQNLNIWDVLDESGTIGAECSRKVVSGRRVAGEIRSIVNARDLQLESASLTSNIACTSSYIWQRDNVMERGGDITLGLGLYRWQISEVCLALKGWIESQMIGKGVVQCDEGSG